MSSEKARDEVLLPPESGPWLSLRSCHCQKIFGDQVKIRWGYLAKETKVNNRFQAICSLLSVHGPNFNWPICLRKARAMLRIRPAPTMETGKETTPSIEARVQ